MIASLRPFLDERYERAGVRRRFRHDVQKHRLVDVIRAAARHEIPADPEQLQRAEIDFLVALDCLANVAPALCKRRRVKHYNVIYPSFFGP